MFIPHTCADPMTMSAPHSPGGVSMVNASRSVATHTWEISWLVSVIHDLGLVGVGAHGIIKDEGIGKGAELALAVPTLTLAACALSTMAL